ncbi:MAG TPA: PilZ domain-containing protein [Dissulfurispiraceae bacterium]|nr:PilZ domain-containing protein [Dissulfurispiraceae bacterium]
METPPSTPEQALDSDLREFSRVDAELPMRVDVVPESDRPSVQARILSPCVSFEEAPTLDVRDAVLAEWLRLMNRKLDTIIRMLAVQEEKLAGMPTHRVNISGGGLFFAPDEKYSLGDMLEFTLRLPLDPSVLLQVYGTVVEIGTDSISTRFIAISDDIRDLIVRFVFQTQREILRLQRKD